MAKITYSDKLKDPRWQKKRLEVFNRDGFKCIMCKDEKTTLNVHHLEYSSGNPWEIDDSKLITVCHHCHDEFETHKNEIDYKVDGIHKKIWTNGHRTMFVKSGDEIFATTYDERGNALHGYVAGIELIFDLVNLYTNSK